MARGSCWPCSLGCCGMCTGCSCNHRLLDKQPKKAKKPKTPKKNTGQPVKKKWWQ